ncbi:hypothetical protein GJ496_009459 [Pomphorhynchus laevis]|nr:hypothetical protein GJ496_009459 [Pomphorhynchus laevis]
MSTIRNNALKYRIEIAMQALLQTFKRYIKHATTVGASSWLTATPVRRKHYHINSDEFSDAIFIQYGLTPSDLHNSTCIYGQMGNIAHLLSCQKGDLPIQM